jgi:hypothetical protein
MTFLLVAALLTVAVLLDYFAFKKLGIARYFLLLAAALLALNHFA